MQLLYGIDRNGDEIIDCFLAANAGATPCPAGGGVNAALITADDWSTVTAVRIALLFRTLQQQGHEQSLNTYQLNDFPFDVPPFGPTIGDTFKRRVFNTTVLIRNMNLQDLTRAPPGGGGGGNPLG